MEEEFETEEQPARPTVGERLREAREAKGLSIDDIASTTRVPKRHLENLETANWAALPAATYSMGFAKAYAGQVGLDREDIGAQLREEMGGFLPVTEEVAGFEPVDPNRAMPRWLVWTALLVLVVVVGLFIWSNERQLSGAENIEAGSMDVAAQNTVESPVAPVAATGASGPVVLSATDRVWLRVTDGGATLTEVELAPGQSYTVPASATNPMLETGRPEALTIRVGNSEVPAVGPAGETVTNVSLLGPDLMRSPAAAATSTAAATPPATRSASPPAPRTAPRRTAPAPAATTSEPAEPAPAEPDPDPAELDPDPATADQ